MNQPEEFQQIGKDAAVFSLLGSAAMLSRILLSDDKHSKGYYIRRMTAAGIVSAFVGLGLQDFIETTYLRYAAVGLAGAASPEIVDRCLIKVRQFLRKTDPLK